MAAAKSVSPASASAPGTENWARAVVDGIDDALFIHDLSGRILEANNAACQRLGYTHTEMLHLTTRDIDDPSFAAGFQDRLSQQMNRGQFRCEGRHRTKDGRVIAVDINTSAVTFDGKPAVLALMRDITQRKAMEDALRHQTDLLQSILDNMGEGVIVADAAGQMLSCNPQARKLLGLPQAAAVFPPRTPDFQLLLPDRATPCPPEQFPLALAARGEEVDAVELFVRHAALPEGRWLSITGRPLRDAVGEVGGGILVCRDISRRKRAEVRQATQYAVTRALDECADLDHAGPVILRSLCEGLDWDVGAMWLADAEANVLCCHSVWHKPELPVQAFVDLTRSTTFGPGNGLPGRVWSGQQPVFFPEIVRDPDFPRAGAALQVGLKASFAFPIRVGGETVGVIETYNRRMDAPDPELLALMNTLGSQIGQVLERQRVEKALRDSEAFYHSLVESLPQNIYRKDREGRVTFANGRYCRTLNATLAELLGKTDFDLFPHHLAQKYRDDDANVMAGGKNFEAVEEHHLPDGTNLFVQVIKTPLYDSENQVIGTLGAFWDVTERKRAEEAIAASERRYRQLTEATQDAIIVADHEGRVSLFNPAAERLFGFSPAEVVGQLLDVLIPEQHRDRHWDGFFRYLRTRQSKMIGRPAEMHGRRKDGSTFALELALSVIDIGGGHVQFLGAIRDLTERNRIRAVLVQNEKMASIGLLSAGVAHEINNPLAFVANNLAVLERENTGLLEVLNRYEALLPRLAKTVPAEAAAIAAFAEEIDLAYIRDNLGRLLARTRDGVDRVTRIVHSLRGLARTDAPRRQQASLPDLVDPCLDIIRGRMKRLNVQVVTNYDPQSTVSCVQSQISQVLLNLLVNAQQAIEAGRPEGGLISVLTKRLDGEMLIEVADNGSGIDADHVTKIFDPFFTTKDVGEGTGLGLSIAHNIIRSHDGRIEVDSQVGVGTRFRIFLPL